MYLIWIAQDVQEALSSLPDNLIQSKDVQDNLDALQQLTKGECRGTDVWTTGMSKVRKAIVTLCAQVATKDGRTTAEGVTKDHETCNRLSMAVDLLHTLSSGRGNSFSKRAAELLQLCVLEHLLGVVPFFNCKSGLDRCGAITALWTTFHQLIVEQEPRTWLWYYLALCYPLLLKVVHEIDGCSATKRLVPGKALRDRLN